MINDISGELAIASTELDEFCRTLLEDDHIAEAASSFSSVEEDARTLLETYVNEIRVGFNLISPLVGPEMRVLEVGCGIGGLTKFFRMSGVDVMGIEPGASGFGFMPEVGRSILELPPPTDQGCILPINAADLNPETHGKFDLIYSVNVIEHIPDLNTAFLGMASVLKPGGQMVHMCPNYFIPYEPHFSIPLVPFFPELTRKMFPKKIARHPGIWEELNFISARRVRRLAQQNNLSVSFDRAVASQTFQRLECDTTFSARHSGVIGSVMRLALRLRIPRILDLLPGEYLTPMVLRMSPCAPGALVGNSIATPGNQDE